MWYGSAGEVWPKLIYYAGDRPDLALLSLNTYRPITPCRHVFLPTYLMPKTCERAKYYVNMTPVIQTNIQIYLVPKNLWKLKFQYHQQGSVRTWLIMIMIHSIVMLTRAGNRGPMGCHRWKPTPLSKYHTNMYHHRANIIQISIYHQRVNITHGQISIYITATINWILPFNSVWQIDRIHFSLLHLSHFFHLLVPVLLGNATLIPCLESLWMAFMYLFLFWSDIVQFSLVSSGLVW